MPQYIAVLGKCLEKLDASINTVGVDDRLVGVESHVPLAIPSARNTRICISLLSGYCEKRPTISMFYGFSDLLTGAQPEPGLSPTARHYPVVLSLPATLTLSTSTLAKRSGQR